jgi:hypothetical protein
VSTTQHHDLLAEITDTVAGQIAWAFWQAGKLPNHATAPPALAGTPFGTLEIFTTEPPFVEVVVDPQSARLLGVYQQKMIIRGGTVQDEVVNTIDIRQPVQLVETTIDGIEVQLLVMNFADASVDNSLLDPVEDELARSILVTWLAATSDTVTTLPVTPPMLPNIRFFPIAGSGEPLGLKVYGNIDGRDPGSMTATPVLHAEPWLPKPPFPPGLAAVVNGEIFLDQLRAELIERNVVAGEVIIDTINERFLNLLVDGEITWDPGLDFPLFPDDGIKIPIKFDLSPKLERIKLTKDLTVGLQLGGVVVSGSIEAIIDNGPDVDADFEVTIVVNPRQGDQLVAHIARADIDVDTELVEVLMAWLFGPVGLLSAQILDTVIDKAASDVVEGTSFPADVPRRTVFLQDIAITNDPTVNSRVTLHLEPFRSIVTPDAVGGSFHLEATGTGPAIARPKYFVGNRTSRELHDDSCRFAELMLEKNRHRFVRAEVAIAEGYDGCRLCLPQFDGRGGAMLSVSLERAAGFDQHRSAPITVTGHRTSSQPTALPTTFSATGILRVSNDDGYWFDAVDVPGVLAQGSWSISVVDGAWSASKTVELLGGDGKHNGVRFHYGVDAPVIGPPIGGLRLVYNKTTEQAKKPSTPAFRGQFLGPLDGTTGTSPWFTSVEEPVSGATAFFRDVPFLRPGRWTITAEELGFAGTTQTRTVDVVAGQLGNLVFHRP